MKQLTQQWRATRQGYNSCNCLPGEGSAAIEQQPDNQLRTFFDNRRVGAGIWKWLHYFEIYDRHFSRFRGQQVHIAEIGIYSGCSLEMWRDYFGPKAHIYGVDIEPDCKVYERDGVKVFIGDQAERSFWREFCTKVPKLDIVIDDASQTPNRSNGTVSLSIRPVRRQSRSILPPSWSMMLRSASTLPKPCVCGGTTIAGPPVSSHWS